MSNEPAGSLWLRRGRLRDGSLVDIRVVDGRVAAVEPVSNDRVGSSLDGWLVLPADMPLTLATELTRTLSQLQPQQLVMTAPGASRIALIVMRSCIFSCCSRIARAERGSSVGV